MFGPSPATLTSERGDSVRKESRADPTYPLRCGSRGAPRSRGAEALRCADTARAGSVLARAFFSGRWGLS